MLICNCVIVFVGIPYESYKGFHELRYQLMETRYTMKYIIGMVEKIPGLLETLGTEHILNIRPFMADKNE